MHIFCCTFTLVKYLASILYLRRAAHGVSPSREVFAAAGGRNLLSPPWTAIEFLLVNTNGGNKWTFPKGSTGPALSHSQAAEREAAEEAGAIGTIEPRHFHLYLHSKGVFWQPGGVQEFVVKAFLMEIHQMRRPDEANRKPPGLARKKRSAAWRRVAK